MAQTAPPRIKGAPPPYGYGRPRDVSELSATMAPAGPPTGYGRSGMGAPPPTGDGRFQMAGMPPTGYGRDAASMGAPPPAGPGTSPALTPYEEGMAAIYRDFSNLGGMAAAVPGRIAGAAKDWYANGGPLGGYTRNWWETGSLSGKPAQAATVPSAEAATVPAAEAATSDRVAQPPADDAPDLPPLVDRAASTGPVRKPPVPVAKPARSRPAAKPAPASGELTPGAPLPPITTPTVQVGATGPRSLFSANLPPPRPVAQPAPPTFGESHNLLSWLAGFRDPAPVQARPDAPQPWRMMNER